VEPRLVCQTVASREAQIVMLVFMVEEPSATNLLHTLLPKIIPEGIEYQVLTHRGKSELKKSLPRKLKEWRIPDSRFVVLHDQDSADCKVLKAELARICAKAGRADTLVRIVCQELESWYFGDIDAVEAVYGNAKVNQIRGKASYRVPDAIVKPSKELERLIPEFQKGAASGLIPDHMDPQRNASISFSNFVTGVQRLCEVAAP